MSARVGVHPDDVGKVERGDAVEQDDIDDFRQKVYGDTQKALGGRPWLA
eukprot:gene40967-65621_t